MLIFSPHVDMEMVMETDMDMDKNMYIDLPPPPINKIYLSNSRFFRRS